MFIERAEKSFYITAADIAVDVFVEIALMVPNFPKAKTSPLVGYGRAKSVIGNVFVQVGAAEFVAQARLALGWRSIAAVEATGDLEEKCGTIPLF